MAGDRYDELARERFWRKVDKTGDCWLWTGAISEGYGSTHIKGKTLRAHRVAYEMCGNVIPDGKTLDHLCRVRRCVNPAHLEPVSNRENILRGVGASARNIRKTHCPKGHPLSGTNVYIKPKHPDWRMCLVCKVVDETIREYKRMHPDRRML